MVAPLIFAMVVLFVVGAPIAIAIAGSTLFAVVCFSDMTPLLVA